MMGFEAEEERVHDREVARFAEFSDEGVVGGVGVAEIGLLGG